MVVNALKNFNTWVDEFVLELAKPLMLLMFIMGTADVLTQGQLADQWWFAYSWAIIQAVTIDGLFFAVWYRLFSARWENGNRVVIVGLIGIGLVLSLVVVSTNAILSFQQLWGVGTSQDAMVKLGIDPKLFTLVRSFLVVGVTIMVAFVYHKARAVVDQDKSINNNGNTSGNSGNTNGKVVNLTERSGKSQKIPPEIKEEVVNLMREGVGLKEISDEFGIAYTTLHRWKQKHVDTQAQTQEATD